MTPRKSRRLSKREQQRITTIRTRHGADAFRNFGKKGGRGHKGKTR